jgi:hypothetical protein
MMGEVHRAMQWSTQGAIGIGIAGYNAWSALSRQVESSSSRFSFGQISKSLDDMKINQEGIKATQEAQKATDDRPYTVLALYDKQTQQIVHTKPYPGQYLGKNSYREIMPGFDANRYDLLAIGHTHMPGSSSFSGADKLVSMRLAAPIYKNNDQRQYNYDKWYSGLRSLLNQGGAVIGAYSDPY